MPLVDFSEPDEMGGRMFKSDAGDEFYFYGPEAEQLANELARQPDLRLAQAGPAVDFGGVRDLEQNWAQQDQPAPQQMRRDVPMMLKRSEVQAPPTPPVLPSSGAPAPVPMAPAEEPLPMVRYGASKGVNPEALKRSGVFVPTEETVSDAVPVDPELAQVRQAISTEEQALRQNMAETQAVKARAQELQAAAALPELEMRAAEAQHQQRQIERLYEQERADVGAMIDEHRSRTVNPNRYWTSKSAFGQASNFLGVILGALASGVSGVHGAVTPNTALDMLNREADIDIKLQQDEIDREGANARNALALLQHRFGDVEQAKDSLKLAMHDVADMQMKELAASYGTQEAAQAYALWNVEHMKERELLERKIREASVGKHATKLKFTQPVAASAGRMVPIDQLPLAEQAKAYGQVANIAKAKATIRGGGVDPDIAAKENARAGAAAQTARTESTKELGKSLADTQSAQAAYDELLASAGLRFNADTNKVEGYRDPKTGETVDIPGVGLVDRRVPRIVAGQKAQALRQRLDNALDLLGRARTGAAMPAYEKEAYEHMILGAGTEQEFVSGMEMLQRQINDVRDMHRARFGPGAVRQLEQNRAGVERDRSQKAQAADLEPY